MSSPRVTAVLRAVIVAAWSCVAAASLAAPQPTASDATELKAAFDAARANAASSSSLDAAYELLGVTGTAREQGQAALASDASATFIDLIGRVTAAAVQQGGTTAQDTLDQLVDLRFFAKSIEATAAMNALDANLRKLFPVVSGVIERHVQTATDWDEKLGAVSDLGSLQASAAQVLLTEPAAAIGTAFETRLAALEAGTSGEADEAERARKLSAIADARRQRQDLLDDAAKNNVDAVAAQIRASGRTEQMLRPAEGDTDPNMVPEATCVETAVAGKPDTAARRKHDQACLQSGRTPSTARCPLANVSLACYGTVPGGEQITYSYRNTGAEATMRSACGSENLLSADRIPPSGAAFRTAGVALAFVCAPIGDTAED